MNELGLSPNAVQSILDSKNPIERYQHRLEHCYAYLSENNFPDKHFKQLIEPELISILKKNGKSKKVIQKVIRESIRRWALLSQTKAQFLIRLHQLIPEELLTARKINSYYKDVPHGCVKSKKAKNMTIEDIQRWHEGNLLMAFKNSSYINLVGVLFSEQFFAVETMCRMILIGSCIEFSLKSIDEKTTIQHKEIYQSLRRMGDLDNDKLVCKICSFKKHCRKCEDYLILAQVYELYYHLRVIKDYKKDFWSSPLISSLFTKDNLNHMFGIVMKVEQIEDRINNGYWLSPFRISRDNDEINTLLQKISNQI